MSRGGENNGFLDQATGRFTSTSFSLLTFERLRAQASALSDVFAFASFSQVNVLVDGEPEIDASAQLVSGNYYTGLGVPAAIGRTLTPDDDRPSAVARRGHLVPLLGATLRQHTRRPRKDHPDQPGPGDHRWRYRTGLRRCDAGRRIAGRLGAARPPFALPAGPGREGSALVLVGPHHGQARTRRDAGTGPRLARASLSGGGARRAGSPVGRPPVQSRSSCPDAPTLAADPGAQGENDLRRKFARPLHMLMGLVGLVLAAACANVANLLLARSAARRREIALRLALGARRSRLVRQLLTESLLLAFGGAALGIALAAWGRDLLLALRPFGNASVVLDLPLDARVLGFTIAVTVATALLFGLAPALRATRVDLRAQFQSGGRTLGERWPLAPDPDIDGRPDCAVARAPGEHRPLRAHAGQPAERGRRVQPRWPHPLPHRRHICGLLAGTVCQAPVPPAGEAGGLPGVRAATFSSVALLSSTRQNKRVTVPGHTPAPGDPDDRQYQWAGAELLRRHGAAARPRPWIQRA